MISHCFRSEFSRRAQTFSLLLVCLTLCGSAAAQDTKLASAESTIVSRIASSGADVGVYFKTLDGKSEWSSRAEDVFHAASTMKIPVMIEVFHQINQGKLKLDNPLPVKNEFHSIVDGSVYTLSKEEPSTPLRDAREFGSLLNACGRMGKPGLGVALSLGDRGASFEEAQEVYSEYRKFLSKYMNWITSDPASLVQKGHLVIVRGEGVIDENMTGAVSSILSSSNLFGGSKVTLVVTATKEGESKVSARGTDQLIEKGLNLGKILQDLSPKYGGYGGGHAIAAGATVQRQSLEPFLTQFERTVESTIK